MDNISDIFFPSQSTVLNSSFADSSGLPYASIVIPSSVLNKASLLRTYVFMSNDKTLDIFMAFVQTVDQLLLVVFCIAQYQDCYQTISSSNELYMDVRDIRMFYLLVTEMILQELLVWFCPLRS